MLKAFFFFLFRIECKTKHRNGLFDLDFTKLFSNFRMNSLKWNHEFRIDVFNFHLLLLFRLFSNGKYSYISSANMISLHYFRLYIELLIYSGRIRIVNMTYLLRVYWARKWFCHFILSIRMRGRKKEWIFGLTISIGIPINHKSGKYKYYNSGWIWVTDRLNMVDA